MNQLNSYDDGTIPAGWPPPTAGDDRSSPGRPARRGRGGLAAGVGAGLLAGGAIGLFAWLPGASSAATEGSADGSAEVQIVAPEQNDDTTTGDVSGTTDETVVPDAGARLREVLQPLVDDGTLESDQADAVSEFLAEQRDGRGGHHGPEMGPRDGLEQPGRHHDGGPVLDVAAEVLGVDVTTLRDELRAGSTLAELAAVHDVGVDTLVDALVADARGRLDQAVADGRIGTDEAEARATEIEERITDLVNGERPAPPARPGGVTGTEEVAGVDDGT